MIDKEELKFNEKIIEQLKNEYGIRFRRKQKRKFLEYAQTKFKDMGYMTHLQEKSRINKHVVGNQNLVIGDIENANVIMCAHYDTPPRAIHKIEIIHGIRKSIWSKIKKYILILVFILILTSIFILILSIMLYLLNCLSLIDFIPITAYIVACLMTLGVSNKKNLNDNTSGVMTIFKIADELKELNNSKVAFVLFDNEEWGLIGSKIFANQNENINNKLFINFDCVGVGDNILILCDNYSIEEAKKIGENKQCSKEKNILVQEADLSKADSDERRFKNRIRFAAFHRNEDGELYIENIHTKKDNELDIDNISVIASIIKEYISKNN